MLSRKKESIGQLRRRDVTIELIQYVCDVVVV
jgi:hypothetical protein